MDQYNKLIDVTIVHPTCSSHIKQAQTQLKTAHDACELKKNKYNKLPIQQQAQFVPFAIQVKTTVKLVFSCPVVQMLTDRASNSSIVILLSRLKATGVSFMLPINAKG